MKAQASLKAAQYAWIPTLNGVGGGFAVIAGQLI